MKLATLKDGSRDGRLVVVSRDLERAAAVPEIATTLLGAVERWDEVEVPLREAAERLEAGTLPGAVPFDPVEAAAPLPRTWQWVDGSVFVNHGRLMAAALHPDKDNDYSVPLVYQGASDDFLGARDELPLPSEEHGIDFEGEVAVILDRVPMLSTPAEARDHIKLLMLVNDVSLRMILRRELNTGFGFVTAKPSSAFSPVAVTPDELGGAWHDGKVHLPLRVELNGEWFGHPNGAEMTFDFGELVSHIASTRNLSAGTVVGSGTISNADRAAGSACIAERRAIELIEEGAPRTPFMSFGDRIRIEMLDDEGTSVFGAIDQRVIRYARAAG